MSRFYRESDIVKKYTTGDTLLLLVLLNELKPVITSPRGEAATKPSSKAFFTRQFITRLFLISIKGGL